MSKHKQLVPVFMPPLAALLSRAEDLKGSPLTETEVVRIRDAATCIMMEVVDASQLDTTRGYRDVIPENCWADWHRLRTEMTGKGYLPKIVLCLVGNDDLRARVMPVLEEFALEHEFSPPDARMVKSFEAASHGANPTLTDVELRRIAAHTSVLYVLSKNFTSDDSAKVSGRLLRAGARLLEAGAIALKCESSGIAHSAERWKELAQQTENASHPAKLWTGLFNAFVKYPIQSGNNYYSCGMHLLGKPDLIVDRHLLEVAPAVELFSIFALYLLVECPVGGFGSGNTFNTSANAPRYRILWETCVGYEEDDYYFNPFGRWRFTSL